MPEQTAVLPPIDRCHNREVTGDLVGTTRRRNVVK
jgi:hypothetical protein